LGQWEAAIDDFNGALALEPRFGAALHGLAAAELKQRNWASAETAASRAIALYEDDARRAPGEALLAQVFSAQSRWAEALDAWSRALKSPNPEVDWYLGQAACLGELGQFDHQVEALANAMRRNPSGVLHRAWIRAMVDAGQLDAAMAEIEKGLSDARWQSTWLLLRARVYATRGDREHQYADAARALAELQGRINADRPEPWLVAECGIAQALSNNTEGARAYEKQARELGVPGADLLEISQLLGRATAR